MKKLVVLTCAILITTIASATHYIAYGCYGGKYFMCDVDDGIPNNIHTFGPCDGTYVYFGKIVSDATIPDGITSDVGTENMINSLDFTSSAINNDLEYTSSISSALTKDNTLSIYINADHITDPVMKKFILGK